MLKIINPTEEIKKVIPELEEIGNYGHTKTIAYTAWDNRLKTMETKNLNKYGRSISWCSLESYFNPCMLGTIKHYKYNSPYKTITINEPKYQLIRKYVMSEEFNSTGD